MGLNKVKTGGNMYQNWITNTWNPLAGVCKHACKYCSSNKFYYPVLIEKYSGKVRLAEKELLTNLGKDNFIFVCAQHDLFAEDIPLDYIIDILNHCKKYPDNKYLFQSKNPERMVNMVNFLPENSVVCTTVETNHWYPEFMGNTPKTHQRVYAMSKFHHIDRYVTIEPIMEFNIDRLVVFMEIIRPSAVFIGADSGNNKLPEPSKEKILKLIECLETFTIVNQKSNLKRLLK